MRRLLFHQAEGFEEHGVSVAMTYDPSPATPVGLRAEVTPTWGARATGGASALWRRDSLADRSGAHQPIGRGLDSRIGYGLRHGRFVGTPRVGLRSSEYGRDWQIGYGLESRRAAGVGGRTIHYARAVLRAALNQALRWGLVSRNLASLTDPPRYRAREIAPLTPEQAKRFLAAVAGHRLEALFTVAVGVGLRLGEALGLPWDAVNLDAGKLSVRQTLERGGEHPRLGEPKSTRSRRTIWLPRIVIAARRKHRARQLQERLIAAERWNDSGLVFTTEAGVPLDGCNINRTFKVLLRQAGLPAVRYHDLRHTAATLLLAQGVDLRTIMETLGHSQISLTANLYAHVVPALKDQAAAKMDQILDG